MEADARLDARVQARDEGGAYQLLQLITGRRLRRQWTVDEKARIIAESAAPDANVSEVARRHGVSRGLLNVWRRDARDRQDVLAPATAFVPVRVDPEPEVASAGMIEVELTGGRVRLSGGVDPALAMAVIAAVRERA